MATTAAELRSLMIRLSENAERDLALLWAQLDAATVADGLMDVLPTLVGEYGDTATTVTADWYDEYRSTLNINGSFAADLADPNLGAEALAGWGSQLAQDNWDTALAQLTGGLVKRVMTASRQTVIDNADRDPQARGWMRVARASGCGFCQMLAGRGNVFQSRSTATFASHDNCQCTAVPAFGGRPLPVKPYTPTSRNITDADRARAREWIKNNL